MQSATVHITEYILRQFLQFKEATTVNSKSSTYKKAITTLSLQVKITGYSQKSTQIKIIWTSCKHQK